MQTNRPTSLIRDEALARAVDARAPVIERAILGITGAPAAGKSTYAEELVAELVAEGHKVALVPMDGYHLAQSALEALGLAEVKGAPHTFDGVWVRCFAQAVEGSPEETIWAPRFDRELEDSIAASIGVGAGGRRWW